MSTISLVSILIILLIYCTNAQVSIVGSKLTASSGAIVQETGSITIEFNPSGITYATGDIISIVFATGTTISTSSPTCTELIGSFTISSCSYQSSTLTLSITISNPSSSIALILMSVDKFVYPMTSLSSWPSSGGATFTVTSSGGTSKGIATSVKLSGVGTGSITTVTIAYDTSKPNVGDSSATITITLVVPHLVPSGGSITVYFPTQPVSGNAVVSSPTCADAGGTLSSSLSCSYTSSTQLLTLSNILTSSKSGTFKFTVSGITNPISLQPVTGMTIATIGTDSGQIDTGTGSWSVPNAATVTGMTFSQTSSTVVSTISPMRIIFTLPFPIQASPIIEFTFPTEITIDSQLASYVGFGLFTSGTSFLTKSSSVVKIQGASSSTASSTSNIVIFSSIRNPNMIKTTGTLSMNLYTSSNYLIATVTSGVTLSSSSLTAGTITVSSITPDNYVVQTSGILYKFVFNPPSPLVNNSTTTPKITISFPSTITLASSCTFSNTAGALSSSLTCTATNSGADHKYELTSCFGSSSYTTSTTSLEIKVGTVTNPDISGNPGTFTISTYMTQSSADYLVDTATFSTLTITTGTLTSPTTTADSYLAYKTGVSYTIGFTTQHRVVLNGIVVVTFPSEIIISDSSTAVAGCRAAYGGASLAATTCTVVSSSQIKFTGIYSSSSTTTSAGSVVLKIPGVRNQRSLAPSSSFTITTTDSSGVSIDSLALGFTITMTSVSELQAVSVQNTNTNKINGAYDPYKVIVTVQTPTASGDKIVLQFPTSMTFPTLASSLTCAAGTNVGSITCSMTSSSYIITATISTFSSGSVSAGSQFDFTINTLGNPISLSPFTMQSISYVDSASYQVNSYSSATSIAIQNTQAGTLTSQSLGQSSTVAGSTSTYTFTFTPANAIPQNANIQVVYPSTLTVPSTITCLGLTGIPANTVLDCTSNFNSASRTFLVKNGFTSTTSVSSQVSFQVSGITNPTSISTTSFTLSTMTGTGNYMIDTVSTGLVPQLDCNYPCKTCSSSDKSKCLSCFTQAESGLPYLQGTTCQAACNTGYTPAGGTTCVACDSNCYTCSTTSTSQCTSCNPSGTYPYLYSVTSQCYSTCPSGSYLDSTTCKTCVSPCSTCSDAVTCTSCLTSSGTPYLNSGGTCTSSCGSGKTPINYVCTNCVSPCLTCSTTTSTCTSCTGSLYIYRSSCISTCPSSTLASGSSCLDCDSKCLTCAESTTSCTTCANGLFIYNSSCQVCPTGYQGNSTTGYCVASGTTITTSSTQQVKYSVVYFPFIIIAIIFVLIAVGGKLKDSKSQIFSTIISFWGVLEFFLYIVLGILAFRDHDLVSILAVCIVIWISLIITNIIFVIMFRKIILQDENFLYWKSRYVRSYRGILIISCLFSFKFVRMFYSRFFGLDHFCCGFTNPNTFHHPINITSIVNAIVNMIPIFIIALIGLIAAYWGTQFYITCLEACIFIIAFIILTIIEIKTAKMYGYNKIIDPGEVFAEVHSIPESDGRDEIERKLRRDALKGIINTIKGGNDVFNTNRIEDCIKNTRDYIHDRYSLPDQHQYKEDEDEDDSDKTVYPHSYPISPKTRQQLEYPLFPLSSIEKRLDEFPDNVYADSKPPNPLKGKLKLQTHIKSTQTFAKEGAMGGAFNINEDFFRTDTHNNRKVKHTKRRNAYYNQVEQEDEEGFTERTSRLNKLGVIYEEDEHGRKFRKSTKFDSDSDYDSPSKVPIDNPDPKDFNFNEHSIMGEFDKDEKGNIILLTNEKGNLVCKNGRKVNEKGYLRDRYGHILYAHKGRVRAFNEKQLDNRGDIPLPYSWNRYNFNAFDVSGNIKINPATGSPMKIDHRKGEFPTDLNGFPVNPKGFSCDKNGNIISKADGEVKIDKFQQTKDGDIPLLYTYDARRFHIRQVMGDFDRDEDGHIIILSEMDEDGNAQKVDKRGKPVNGKGYLIDGLAGNIVSQDGILLFEKQELSPDGEFPKIFPFTKFNIDEIRGDLEKDENGKIKVIHENEKGEILDNRKRRVNAKGYLIDNEGNILDQRGNRVFDCDLIDDSGEIPKVFRIGLLRSDSTTSLNRFLEEIEENKHRLGLDDNDLDSAFEEEEKLLMDNSENDLFKSKHTSENNSAMGDRPSNYNTANLENFQKSKKLKEQNLESSLSSDDFDVEDPEFLEAIKERKVRRKINKHKYKKPSKKDIILANAYGGVARGSKIDKTKQPLSSSRSSKNRIIPIKKLKNKDGTSIAGESIIENARDGVPLQESKKTLEADTRINYGISNTQNKLNGEEYDIGETSLQDDSILKEKNLEGLFPQDDFNKVGDSQDGRSVSKGRGISKYPKDFKKKRNKTRKRARKIKNKNMASVAPSDLDKLYGKEVDDFLNESDWDIDSVNNRSQVSYKSTRSNVDRRIRGLESIYLQRLEAGTRKKVRKKPRFRALQDRYMCDEDAPKDDDYTSSIFSEERNKKDSYFD